MATASQTEQDGSTGRKVLSIDPDFHQRIKVLAAVSGVQLKDVLDTILDYTVPKLESGELEIQRPSISASSEEGVAR